MNQQSSIVSINISSGGIPKNSVDMAYVTKSGLKGDGHNHEKHYNPIQAVCLQDMEMLDQLCKEGYSLDAGSTGENLTVRNLNVNHLPLGTILEVSDVVMEISKVRKPCYVLDSINPKLKEDIIDRCGMYAKVLQEGVIAKGEVIRISQSTISK